MPQVSAGPYDVDSLVERWEEKLVCVLHQNNDELLTKIQLLVSSQHVSHGCGAAADVADVKPPSGFSLSDVTPMSFPSRMNLQYPRPVRLEDELMPVLQVENEIQKGSTKVATQPMQAQIDECVQHDEYDDLWQGQDCEMDNAENADAREETETDFRTRLSMSSLTSREEKSFRENLVSVQKAKTNDIARSRSALPSSPTLLGKIRGIVHSWRFEAFFACAILSNSILIGVQVNDSALHPHQPSDKTFFIVEQVYAAIFLVELILRILAEGQRFFCSSPDVGWNYLDILIVCTSVLTLVTELAEQSVDSNLSGNVRIIRILRVTRVMRVVRIVKIVRFIRALRSLVHSIFSTMKVLMWSVLLLVIIIYVFAIVFTDVATSFLLDVEEGVQSPVLLRDHFDSLERSMQTLFHCISNGVTWGALSDKLNSISRIWGYLLLLYIAFCLFAVLNVMTAVFCQSAIESAERDQELVVQSVAATKQQQIELFMSVFEGIQEGRRQAGLYGTNVTFAEFEDLFNEPRIRTFFQSLDLETSDAWTLFKLMDTSGNGDLDATEFVEGCMRLKGPARSIDVAILMQEHKRIRKKVMAIAQGISDIHSVLVMSPMHLKHKQAVLIDPTVAKPTVQPTWPVAL